MDSNRSKDEIERIRSQSCPGPIFAAKLMAEIFKPNELEGSNVQGRGSTKDCQLKPLDKSRIEFIKNKATSLFNLNGDKEFWSKCRKIMNRQIKKLNHNKVI